MMSRIALVFDLDDTLYPEQDYAFSGYKAVARRFSERLGDEDSLVERMIALYHSEWRNCVFNRICEETGFSDAADLIPEMIETFRSHHPTIHLFEDAEALLESCQKWAVLGLISDGWLVAQQAKFDALGIRDRFESVIFTDQWGREYWKPHPRAFEETQRVLEVSADQCIYIGDNLAKDFVAPNRLGWRTIFVERAGGVHAGKVAPDDGEPTVRLDDLHGVLPWLSSEGLIEE